MSTYDYVIVGAGSAGCVLAARLSEDPDVKVLLLEAGPPDVKENVHVPLGYLSLAKTDVDWDYSTARLKTASLACEGFVEPLILRTYCSAEAWTSSGVAGGSKLWRVRMLRHMP